MGVSRRLFIEFAGLAFLLGPASSFVVPQWSGAMGWRSFAGGAVTSGVAGAALVLVGASRREPMLRQGHWIALIVLLLPQWLNVAFSPPYVRAIPWLHETPWGVAFLLTVAAPLWLGLLSALQLAPIETPRAAVGAGIAGIGAVCLVIPVDAYRLAPEQAPLLAISLCFGVARVYTWFFASPRLASTGAMSAAGWFLLLQAAGNSGFWALLERGGRQPVAWRTALLPLAMGIVLAGGVALLWFRLLKGMALASFCMVPLAGWAATLVAGFAFLGFLSWQSDVALAIAVAAIVFALRRDVVGEQPTTLGLG